MRLGRTDVWSRVRCQQGGVGMRILMAVVTLVVVGVFIVVLLGNKEEKQKYNYDKALTIAEYGLGEAMMKLQSSPSWRDGFKDVPYDEGSYSVSVTAKQMGDTLVLAVKSTGRSGSVARSKDISLSLEVTEQGDSIWHKHSAF